MNERLRVEDVRSCLFCKTAGEQLYEALRDWLYGAEGTWGMLRCPRCGLSWLNPRPIREDIGKVYRRYWTHAQTDEPRILFGSLRRRMTLSSMAATPGYSRLANGADWKYLGRFLRLFPPLREYSSLQVMSLDGEAKGRLLDVGCGNGEFLSRMQKAGWEVSGVEPDPVAAETARSSRNLPIVTGTVEQAKFPDESFEAITMHHVIEHVHDPVALLQECSRVLKVGGRLVIATPNIESLGHRIFGHFWRGLEPPRHIYLFSPKTLEAAVYQANLQVKSAWTSGRSARFIYAASHALKKSNREFLPSDMTWWLRSKCWFFRAREEFGLRANPTAGEEVILIATKQVGR